MAAVEESAAQQQPASSRVRARQRSTAAMAGSRRTGAECEEVPAAAAYIAGQADLGMTRAPPLYSAPSQPSRPASRRGRGWEMARGPLPSWPPLH